MEIKLTKIVFVQYSNCCTLQYLKNKLFIPALAVFNGGRSLEELIFVKAILVFRKYPFAYISRQLFLKTDHYNSAVFVLFKQSRSF